MMTIHFIRPAWLFGLIPAIIYLFVVLYISTRKNPWRKVCDPHLLPALLVQSGNNRHAIFKISLLLLFSTAIFALAGPSWKKVNLPVYRELSSLMLVLDVSQSMLATDLNPDRLTRAKFKIRDLINLSQNTQMGLVAFSKEAFVVTPLSEDARTLSGLIDELHPYMMPVQGSDLAQGLIQASTLLKQTGIPHSNILLITASFPPAESFATAKAIRQAGNHLSVLAMLASTSENQATIDALETLASQGGGTLHLFTKDDEDIKQILKNNFDTLTRKDQSMEKATLWQDAGPWFCLLLIPLVLLVLRETVR